MPSAPSRSPHTLVLGAAALALAIGGVRLFASSDATFVTDYSKDDSYYFFQIARNIARGLGPSFDGLELTNGFTPVWGALLVPVFAVVEDAMLAARVACALSLVAFVGGLVLFARVLAPSFGAWPTALATAGALLATPLLVVGLQGMDFSINLLMEVLVLAAFVRLRAIPPPRPCLGVLGAGALAGLMCVQRPDTGVLAVLLALPVLVAWRGGRPRLAAAGVRDASLLVAGALAVAVPYLVGSYVAYDTPLPVSGKLKTHRADGFRARAGWEKPLAVLAATPVGVPVQPAQALVGGGLVGADAWPRGARYALLLGFAGLGVASVRRRRSGGVEADRDPPEDAPRRTAVATPVVLHAIVHTGVVAVWLFPYVGYGSWYLAPQALAGVVLAAAALRGGARLLGPRARPAGFLVGAVLAAGVATAEVRLRTAPPPPDDRVEAVALDVARHLREVVPPGQKVGAFNAGRLAYFADMHVVNLDGLVNTNAFAEEVWISDRGSFGKRFLRYVLEKEIHWFVDVWDARYPEAIVDQFFPSPLRPYFELRERWPTDRTYEAPVPGAYELMWLDIDAIRRAELETAARPGAGGETADGRPEPLEVSGLAAIGYAAGSEPAEPGPPASPVTVHDPEAVAPGLNLIVSGHAPEALLVDVHGRVRHRWSHRLTEPWPDGRRPPRPDQDFWRRAAVLPDGALLAIYEGLGLVKLDRDSRLLWAYAGFAHHDLEVADDGRIFVLTRVARVVPRLDPDAPVLDDRITTLDADGNELESVSLLDCFEASPYAAVLDAGLPPWDPFHTNTVERLDGRHADRVPAFAEGNFLVSLRENDLLAVVDPRARTVVWTAAGAWRRQHQPTLLRNGHLLLFDNQGLEGSSRVLELDPVTLETVWSWGDDLAPGAFYSGICGSSQRLANGNTLAVESVGGRAVEVTPEGEVVWEYRSPYRTGGAGEDGTLTATLFDLVRLEGDRPPTWLE